MNEKKKKSIRKEIKTNKTTTKQTKTATTYNSSCLNHRWRCYHAIALNDQQVGHTFPHYLDHCQMMPHSKGWLTIQKICSKRRFNVWRGGGILLRRLDSRLKSSSFNKTTDI